MDKETWELIRPGKKRIRPYTESEILTAVALSLTLCIAAFILIKVGMILIPLLLIAGGWGFIRKIVEQFEGK